MEKKEEERLNQELKETSEILKKLDKIKVLINNGKLSQIKVDEAMYGSYKLSYKIKKSSRFPTSSLNITYLKFKN